MPLLSVAELWLVIAGTMAGIASGFAIFESYRARTRLAAGKCSRCGQPWSTAYPDADRYLIQGREVCAPCSSTLRTRLPRLLRRLGWVGAACAAGILYGLGVQPALEGRFVIAKLASALAIPVLFSATTLAVLALAARRNRHVLATTKGASLLRAPNEEL
jgi:hypothetical protein